MTFSSTAARIGVLTGGFAAVLVLPAMLALAQTRPERQADIPDNPFARDAAAPRPA